MYDVFISYSTRGATTKKWLIRFTEELEKYYGLNYSKKLRIWYAIKENNVGDNFEEKVFAAIEKSLVFLMILDPAYIQSPETIKEVTRYEETRTNANEAKNYISVIKWRGNKEAELKSFVDSNLIVSYFSDYNKDRNEEEYDDTGSQYINEIQNISKAIRVRELEASRKTNAQKLLNSLSQLTGVPKLYVAFVNTIWKNNRLQLVNQLAKTLLRTKGLSEVKVLPDYLTTSTPGNDLTNEDLAELFYDENPHGLKCLNAMLDSSTLAMVPFLIDKTNEAEELLNKIQFQLDVIKSKSREKKLPVTILADIPSELYVVPRFIEFLNNSNNEYVKVIKEVDIGTFMNSYMDELVLLTGTKTTSSAKKDKHIYIVEHYNHNNEFTHQPANETETRQLELEVQHRRNLRRYIFSKNFVLIPSIQVNANLIDTIEYHKKSLNISDGIIIYRGIREEPFWCIQQQSDTYNIILDLGEDKKNNLQKAVYVDSLQKVREREEYFYYKYDVIIEDPKDLDEFLCKI